MAKTKSQKNLLFANYKGLVDSGTFVVVSLNKIPAPVIASFRKDLQESGSKLHLIKNKVFMKAISDHESLKSIYLRGQLAILSSSTDIVSALKKLDDMQKMAKETLFLKGMTGEELANYQSYSYEWGILEGKFLEAKDIDMLSKLPGKQSLLSQLIGTMTGVINGFMNVANGNMRKLIYALEDLRSKKA